jgi:hypothetical protein
MQKAFFAVIAMLVFSVTTVFAGTNVTPVPEPSSLLLLISGVGGLAFWLRKRR